MLGRGWSARCGAGEVRLQGDTGRESSGSSPGLARAFNAASVAGYCSNLTQLQLCALSSAGKGWDGRAGVKFNRVESEVIYSGKDFRCKASAAARPRSGAGGEDGGGCREGTAERSKCDPDRAREKQALERMFAVIPARRDELAQ